MRAMLDPAAMTTKTDETKSRASLHRELRGAGAGSALSTGIFEMNISQFTSGVSSMRSPCRTSQQCAGFVGFTGFSPTAAADTVAGDVSA